MQFQLLISAISFFSALLAVILSITAWYRRNLPESLFFSLLMVASAIYAAAFGFEARAVSLADTLAWTHVEYIGIVWIPTLLILFSLRFAGVTLRHEEWLMVALCALSVLIYLCQFSIGPRGLFYSAPKLTPHASMLVLRFSRGPLYYLLLVYHIVSFVVAVTLCCRRILRTQGIFREQAVIVLLGLMAPMLCYLLYIAGASQGLDINPLSFPAMGLLIAYGFMRANLFDIAPVALRVVFDSMREGCMIIDAHGRVVDFNRAMGSLLPRLCADGLGQRAWRLFDTLPELLPLLEASEAREQELVISNQEPVRCFKVCLSIIPGRNESLLGRILVFVDTSREYLLTQQLREMATHDELTNLLSRRHFFELARQSFMQAQRGAHPFSVVMMDIDYFKRINDTHGHMAGDLVLVEVSTLFKSSIRACDILCRYGGEEFLLVLPETALEEAREVAERIRLAVMNTVHIPGDMDDAVTLSLGLSSCTPAADASLEAMIREADEALYTAKNTGRNRVCP